MYRRLELEVASKHGWRTALKNDMSRCVKASEGGDDEPVCHARKSFQP